MWMSGQGSLVRKAARMSVGLDSILYPEKIRFKNESRVKTKTNRSLRWCHTSRFTLRDILKRIL